MQDAGELRRTKHLELQNACLRFEFGRDVQRNGTELHFIARGLHRIQRLRAKQQRRHCSHKCIAATPQGTKTKRSRPGFAKKSCDPSWYRRGRIFIFQSQTRHTVWPTKKTTEGEQL